MEKKQKYLAAILIGFFLFSILAKYYHFIVERDFMVTSTVSCNPSIENCFIYECIDGEACDEAPYKYIEKNARNAPECNPYTEESCPELFCEPEEVGCEVTLCSEDILEDGESCISYEEGIDSEEIDSSTDTEEESDEEVVDDIDPNVETE